MQWMQYLIKFSHFILSFQNREQGLWDLLHKTEAYGPFSR